MSENITISTRRRLRDLDVQCTIEEQHDDQLTVTDHPVEQGAAISDHAYLNPSRLVMQIGYSNSSREAGGDENYVADKYAEILALQAEREPFSVGTGKRVYDNMLITGLAVVTDEKTEATLLVTVTMRQVIIVETQVVAVPPADVQANPQNTAAPVNTGQVQPKPAALSPPGA